MKTCKKIYIAGPMTDGGKVDGPVFEANMARFHLWAKRLRDAGYEVENPAENGGDGVERDWSDWMRLGVTQLMQCDAIFLLDGWKSSRGARLEAYIADELDMVVFTERYVEQQGIPVIVINRASEAVSQ